MNNPLNNPEPGEAAEITNEQIAFSINEKIVGKVSDQFLKTPEANNCFEKRVGTRYEFAEAIDSGFAYSFHFNGKRKRSNFHQSGFAAIDFDNWNLEEALANPFIKTYAAIIHTTPSHRQADKGDRFRAVFVFEKHILDANRLESIIKVLMKKFPQCDVSCKDAARFFFGSRNSVIKVFDGVLTEEVIKEIQSSLHEETILINDAANKHTHKKTSIEEVRKALGYIPAMPGYNIWRDIVFAIASEFGDEGKAIIEEWSPDYKTNGVEVDKLFAKANGRITIGTLFYYATQNGYRKSTSDFAKKTEGQVALENIFNNGDGFACFGSELYMYKDSYYQKLDDLELERTIAIFFDKYVTGETKDGKYEYKFATPEKIDSALNFVKKISFVHPDLINPRGLNFQNGYLKFGYEADSKLNKELVKPSSEIYFTYVIPCDYNPDADSNVLESALDDMLDETQQDILLRVMSAALDLEEIRRRHGRAVRILYLWGEGSNGKDTLRFWLQTLFGDAGLTNVSLKDFKLHDEGKGYNTFALTKSKINWPSENSQIAIDHCQSLKSFATGDPMTVRDIYKSPVTFNPKAVGLFNINRIPNTQSHDAAIYTRTCIIRFENTFCTNPDPKNPREKKANPLFKEDQGYVKEAIISAFANLLLLKFEEVLKEGIEYSSIQELTQEVREDNSHFQQFISEVGIAECSISEGSIITSIYSIYLGWCISYRLLETTTHGNKIWNDPNPYDKLIRSVREFAKQIKNVFPNLLYHRTGEARLIGIKSFNGDCYESIYDKHFDQNGNPKS